MNRQEIITKIQNDINKFFKSYESIGEDERELLNEIFDDVEKLRQPITLAEFLGWEEDVVYFDNDTNIMYKIQDDNLLEIIGQSLVIDSIYNFSDFSIKELRKFKKMSPTKYNLILKSAYRKLFDLQDNEKYFTICIQDGDVFHSKSSTDNSKYQAQFTLEEIEEIKQKYNIDLCIYDVLEAQE